MVLSRRFFEETAKAALFRDFPLLALRLAAGLAGNGSECFGYDDELSTDHDWGVDFFLWTAEEDRARAPELREWKRALLEAHPELPMRERSRYGAHIDVCTAGDFYASLVGFPEGPRTIAEWRAVPQENLAMAVNGEVFMDGAGAFTAVRERLLGFYPEDLRLKKIAARCMAIAQTGQYNLARCEKRGDAATARAVLCRFSDEAAGLVFLLGRVYKPYYKWQFRRLAELPLLGAEAARAIERIALLRLPEKAEYRAAHETVEALCALMAAEIRRQGISSSRESFFTAHGEEAQSRIKDDFLQSLPAQYE